MRSRILIAAAALGVLGVFSVVTASAQSGALSGSAASNEVRCIDLPAASVRPKYGCFNVARVSGLRFNTESAVWLLYRFASKSAAEAARSQHGTVVGEAGAYWLSEIVPADTRAAALRGGTLAAQVGPLALPAAKSLTATLAYAIMRPGQRSRTHAHPGPEAFYVVSGEQCVETPSGVERAKAGEAFSEPAATPMELMATGSGERRGFALVLHDSSQPQAAPVPWHSSGRCGS